MRIGDKFHKWVILDPRVKISYGQYKALCRCQCGTERLVRACDLKRNRSTNCGCIRNIKIGNVKRSHGLRNHPLYGVWVNMRNRCFRQEDPSFSRYGGRGISVSEEWCKSFSCFFDWCTQNGWKRGLQIDRIDNDGNYEPTNCRFVTNRENSSNTRRQKEKDLPVGVRRHRKRFQAIITKNYRTIFIGTFDTADEARNAYLCTKKEITSD